MTIAEHKLNIVHRLEELSEESLIEIERLIARLLKVKQKSDDISDLGGFFKNNAIVLSDEELCKPVDFNEELT
jgi:hypothetical protein